MSSNDNLKAVCSVRELAEMLCLSRARFYQLQKAGVFPMPLYCIHSRRPFYTLELQQQCIAIRKTGIRHNGLPILFNAPRKNKPTSSQDQPAPELEELVASLKELGLNVSLNKVETAIKAQYPQGLPQDSDKGTIIKKLYRTLEKDCKKGA